MAMCIQSHSYSSDQRAMISKYAIESAYAFFHQKLRIYHYSTLDWQKDDIEYAIEDYVSQMDAELYTLISNGRQDFLRSHTTFAEDMEKAVDQLEEML